MNKYLGVLGHVDLAHHEIHADHVALGPQAAAALVRFLGHDLGLYTDAYSLFGALNAELLPAALEARHGRVPLILITADRPADLQGVGAPQTVDQAGLFGAAAKWSLDLEPPLPGEGAPGLAAALAARLVTAALDSPPGPVHLNLRFREPLVPQGPLPAATGAAPTVLPGRLMPSPEAVARLAALLSGRRGMPGVATGYPYLDKLTGVYLSGTKHEEDQPCHLLIPDPDLCVTRCWETFRSPCTRFCPGQVYEMDTTDEGRPRLKLNPSNCLHCKTCEIKDPFKNIIWTCPEGGGGPKYSIV